MAWPTASSTDAGTYQEKALDPSLPIIDAHHHLWSEAGEDHQRYDTSELGEMLQGWRAGLVELSRRDNVYLKLGGIGYRSFVEPQVLAGPRSSEWLARYWGNELLFCIETFGPSRCMFESNFPVDRPLCDYVTLWNTFKRASSDLGHDDRLDLFGRTALRAYRLDQDLP
jgi:L-fuconolactonase